MNNRQNITIASLLLAIFSWHMTSITMFPHTHDVNGVIICHSHPYAGTSDNPGHSHSAAQFDTITQLSFALMLAAVFGIALSVLFSKKHEIRLAYTVPTGQNFHAAVFSRGPPLI